MGALKTRSRLAAVRTGMGKMGKMGNGKMRKVHGGQLLWLSLSKRSAHSAVSFSLRLDHNSALLRESLARHMPNLVGHIHDTTTGNLNPKNGS